MRISPVNKENNPLLLSAMAYAYQFKGKKKHPKINPHGFQMIPYMLTDLKERKKQLYI